MEQLGELRTRWDKFEIMMESHQLMIKDQVRRGGRGERGGKEDEGGRDSRGERGNKGDGGKNIHLLGIGREEREGREVK